MRITVMTTMAKSLRLPPPDPDRELSTETATNLISEISKSLERLKWFLWHGNVFRALHTVEDITTDLETLHSTTSQPSWLKTVNEFDSYLRAPAALLVPPDVPGRFCISDMPLALFPDETS